MIDVKIIATPDAISKLRNNGPQILQALTGKMNQLMIRLQSKVVGEEIPKFFKTDQHIGSSVRVEPAHVDGTVVAGFVDAGGVPETQRITKKSGAQVDYAVVQEYGVSHGWEILPFDKKALAFMFNGKPAIFRRVFHPPLESRPFMRTALDEMEGQITSELGQTLQESLGA